MQRKKPRLDKTNNKKNKRHKTKNKKWKQNRKLIGGPFFRTVYEQQSMLNSSEKRDLAAALKCKAKGNDFFRAGDCNKAAACYAQVVELATPIAHELEAGLVLLTALSNRALCLIKLGHFQDARESAEAALKLRAACQSNPSVATKVAVRLATASQMDPHAGGSDTARRAVLEVGCRYTCTKIHAGACAYQHSITSRFLIILGQTEI